MFSNAVAESQALVARPAIARAIEALELSEDESLHVYANGLTVYLQPQSLQRLLDAVVNVVTLADQLPSDEMAVVDFSDLPSEFVPLVPLASRWGLTDDADRNGQLAQTSTRSLQQLVGAVAPLFGSMNAYLDSFSGRGMPESAAALGALAECACEAQLILKHRGLSAVPSKRLQPAVRARKPRTRRG